MLEPLPQGRWTRRAADHLLSRACFGGSPAQRDALFRLGRDSGVAAAVDSIVNQPVNWSSFPPPAIRPQIAGEDNFYYYRELHRDFTGWHLRQLTDGPPLAAKMFKFWVDHFPIDQGAIHPNEAVYPFFHHHFVLLRDGAVGNFGPLLRGVTWSAGMIRMLDLQASSRGSVNENFSRELLELFTMGVHGAYTEQDVATLARVFTGRKIRGPYPYEVYLDETVYTSGSLSGQQRYVDPEEKTVLTIADRANPAIRRPGRLAALRNPADRRPGDPREQGDAALKIILEQPDTGWHLAWKLWRYFVSPDPPAELAAELGRRWQFDHQWEVKPLLRVLFSASEFYDETVIGDQIKDPCDLLVSASRALELPALPRVTATLALAALGQNLFSPPTIAGWPEPEAEGNGWIGASALFNRLALSALWASGDPRALHRGNQIPAAEFPLPIPDFDAIVPPEWRGRDNLPLLLRQLAGRLYPAHPLEDEEIRELTRYITRIRLGASEEEFLRELLQALLTLPQFQLQ
ncbi:MAG TPA: DUF1800 family protein [Verrucomicrobiales bacterium]|nr:DUF1800 family protein [Verrucomicrobiales bacterium]